jgi:hypothetical protein
MTAKKFSLRGFATISRTRIVASSSAGLLTIVALATAGAASGEAIKTSGEIFSRSPETVSEPGRKVGARAAMRVAKRKPARVVPRADSRTIFLGISCKLSSDCRGREQVCLKEQDANGKALEKGICALPCEKIDAGMSDPLAPTPENVATAKKPPPPRCPKKYQCRSAGAGVPIDLCIKE